MENKHSHKKWLSCQKASELIDKRMELRLSFSEQIQLKLHKCICDACRQYEKQSSILNGIITQHFQKLDFEQVKPIKNDALKSRILSHLKDFE